MLFWGMVVLFGEYGCYFGDCVICMAVLFGGVWLCYLGVWLCYLGGGMAVLF